MKKADLQACLAEVVGTFILVFFGVGVVHTAVLTGAQSGLLQVAIVWGVAISLAIYALGARSGAHMNPAITLSMAALRGFPKRQVAPYIVSQLLGAFCGAAVLYVLFCGFITHFEASKGIVRGAAGSELSGMIYGEYFPNPGIQAALGAANSVVTAVQAMMAEAIGTAFLAFFIFAVTDERNAGRPNGTFAAVMIGLAVSLIISVIAPLTQAGLNPARDFGPRLFAWFAGWGNVAIPGPRGGFFTVYILSPILGALAGGGIYEFAFHSSFVKVSSTASDKIIQPIAISERKECVMSKPKLILVGGFLGSGKTTLLWRAAAHLIQQGKRVGLITNDQAPQLVDTGFLEGKGFRVQEIAGGCFCCRFEDLVGCAKKLIAEMQPDVIIAEPVGSCTDLSATVLQPIKDLFANDFEAMPFTVLVSPDRLKEILNPNAGQSLLHPSARYILQKQLEEADRIVVNKADLLSEEEKSSILRSLWDTFPSAETQLVSALQDEGVNGWLEAVLGAGQKVGQRIVEIDYDVYAEGEAVLGWLNAKAKLSAEAGYDWRGYCSKLLSLLQNQMKNRSAEIAHIKLLLSTSGGSHVANLTHLHGVVSVQGVIEGNPNEAMLTLNARVEMAPEQLKNMVEECLQALAAEGVSSELLEIESLSPGRPQPVHRYDRVV